ncbi:hypothetical protein CR513_17012, partial [Mucuna pruriens]
MYLRDEILPKDPAQAKRLIKEVTRYIIIGGELYMRGFSFLLLRYIEDEEVHYVIKEVHEGLCGSHIGGRALANKIAKVSYYWPTLKGNYMDYVQRACHHNPSINPRRYSSSRHLGYLTIDNFEGKPLFYHLSSRMSSFTPLSSETTGVGGPS